MVEGFTDTKAQRPSRHHATWIMGYPRDGLDHLKTSVAFINWQESTIPKGSPPARKTYEVHRAVRWNRRFFTATAVSGFTDLPFKQSEGAASLETRRISGFPFRREAGTQLLTNALHY